MIEPFPQTPATEAELLRRAYSLAGRTLGQVAERHGLPVPQDLRRKKGWVGELLERSLGAIAGSRAEPDFPHLGVELKTLPVNPKGEPFESTYVCVAPMDGSLSNTWEGSWVRRKLARVLWVPIVGEKTTHLAERMIGGPMLWSPSEEEARILQADWELLTELISQGDHERISARHGEILQLRPKAASSRELTWVLDVEGNWAQTNPKGFYLRRRFTKGLVARHLRVG